MASVTLLAALRLARGFNAPRAASRLHKHAVRWTHKPTSVRLATVQRPPDFSVVGDDDGVDNESSGLVGRSDEWGGEYDDQESKIRKEDELSDDDGRWAGSTGRRSSPARGGRFADSGASWLQRNKAFSAGDDGDAPASSTGRSFGTRRDAVSSSGPRSRPRTDAPRRSDAEGRPARTFRQDFRGTRVFVQGLPPTATWQDLKDHFREVVGKESVVFASVSTDRATGESKCCGVVQFETTEMAATAIAITRNYPLNGYQLHVREDFQEDKNDRQLSNREPAKKGPTPPSKWRCADEANSYNLLSEDDIKLVRSMIKARDDARRRREYEASDNLRNELKFGYGVHLDDRLNMWWVSTDGKVPESVQEKKGDGRWGAPPAWRQIPTTPENDACVNPDLVNGLLKQRDIARREKDFATADKLLEQARTSPDNDLSLRIHDESRTWRIWTDEPPPRTSQEHDFREQRKNMSPSEQCIAIVQEFAPDRVEEIQSLLEKFQGREYQILKNLKKRYVE